MTDAVRSPELEPVLAQASAIARFQGQAAVGAEHLLLATMAADDGPWPQLLVRSGAGDYEQAAKLAGPLPPRRALSRVGPAPAVRPVRRVLVDLAIAFVLLLLRGVRKRRTPQTGGDHVALATDAETAVTMAQRLAPGGKATTGHLLVALASTPGRQVKLLRREHQLVAAAARREVGLDRRRDRWLIALHRPSVAARLLQGRLRAGGRWRLVPWAGMRLCGLLWALTIFFVETTATVGLYLFLWPALLLANGTRAVVGRLLRVDFTVRRAHEVVGGEMDVSLPPGVSDRRVAVAVLAPRLACLVVSIVSLTLLLWQSRRLGVQPFPFTIARLDLIQGRVELAQLVAPAVLLFDGLYNHGPVVGTGVLAGFGAGLLSIPSPREIQLVRLSGGHDLGLGSRALRLLTAPLLLAVGTLATLEAVLPFRGGPLYLTVYVLPLFLALLCAGAIGSALLPY